MPVAGEGDGIEEWSALGVAEFSPDRGAQWRDGPPTTDGGILDDRCGRIFGFNAQALDSGQKFGGCLRLQPFQG
jgi:hypothetical protein